MRAARRLHAAGLGLAALALVAAYLLDGRWGLALLFAALAGLWWLGQRAGWPWTATLGLAGYFLGAALGFLFDLPATLLLAAALGAVAAWDLDALLRRTAGLEEDEALEALAAGHLRWLASAEALGLLLAAATFVVRLDLSYLVLAGIVLALGVSLSLALRYVRISS